MIQEQKRISPVFKKNPSLNDLESELKSERIRLEETFTSREERHRIISRIRMLRSSIDMLKGYMHHFNYN